MKVSVIETPNSGKGRFAVVYGYEAWPRSTLRSRGWLNARTIYEREATDDEVLEQKASPRFLAWRYESWEKVRNDESAYGVDADLERDKYLGKLCGLAHGEPA